MPRPRLSCRYPELLCSWRLARRRRRCADSSVAPLERQAARGASTGVITPGADVFAHSIHAAPADHQEQLRRACAWAVALEREGLVELLSYQGKGTRVTLLPRFKDEQVGLVTRWNDGGMSLWRSVFERRAPESIAPIEKLIGKAIGAGNTTREISDELLAALTKAYREGVAPRRPT